MRRKRRAHSPDFKAKVALAACQGDLTMAELIKKYDVHANQITTGPVQAFVQGIINALIRFTDQRCAGIQTVLQNFKRAIIGGGAVDHYVFTIGIDLLLNAVDRLTNTIRSVEYRCDN